MKLFSALQIKACDAYTITASGISSLELMERAAAECVSWITQNFQPSQLFVTLCGTGNNGGDGLAITRLLHEAGYGVKAFQIGNIDRMTQDCKANLNRLQQLDSSLIQTVPEQSFISDIPPHIIIIDALFGIGLNRPLEGWLVSFVEHVNEFPNLKIAIDIPSGMPADTVPEPKAAIIHADFTLSFQFYKRSFLHKETGVFAGEIKVLDIGLNSHFIEATHTHYEMLTTEMAQQLIKPRLSFSHKGTYGHALMVGGSKGMMGAICLSALAAMHVGCGKLSLLVPQIGYDISQILVPEALCQTNGQDHIESITSQNTILAIGIGPGIGKAPQTALALERFLDQQVLPVVLDADALNIIANKPELLAKIPPNSILTPHPAEFERLFGTSTNSMLQAEQARAQSMLHNINIVLKGHYTIITSPDGLCRYNLSGNAGLATAGSGDVLTGMITGLLAQGYLPTHAAMLGVHLHGLAADKALDTESMESMIARDVIKHIGKAFGELHLR
ncbi:MAG: NAD(P)H-hydrate dehydratase [Bacteroidetes bacterium]|nr:NAD(P)H-hydrate dehydratase [Bacteroidota bacterium]